MKSNSVAEDFNSSKIGYEILFIYLAGSILDLIIHFCVDVTKNNKVYWKFANSLNEHYKSLEWNVMGPIKKICSGYFTGAVLIGFACVIALLIMKLFMFSLEITNDDDDDLY
jgi:hypothetical protein